MTKSQVISQTQAFIKEKFNQEGTGHDYWHIHRVLQLARHIAAREKGADMFVAELGSLLHDIADFKFHDDPEAGPKATRAWLSSLKVDEAVIVHVEDIVRNVSFKGAKFKNNLTTLEGQIVHDADKLDALGAIGIARAFVYGGARNKVMHDPDRPLEEYDTVDAFKHNTAPTINHFYEKILLLKDRMFTKTGKQMAQHRHEVVEQFLKEFHDEWDGRC